MHFKTVDQPPNFELSYLEATIDRWLNEGIPKEAFTDRWGIDSLGFSTWPYYYGSHTHTL